MTTAEVKARLLSALSTAWTASQSCERCGAGWPGSVVFEDGEPRCLRCGAERPMPVGIVKAYADIFDGATNDAN